MLFEIETTARSIWSRNPANFDRQPVPVRANIL
jgi:hypothetical protein